MKVSIINAVLNSPEVVKRQILHYNKIGLPGDVELIIVDDGSKPPLKIEVEPQFTFSLYATNDYRPWTQPAARNFGAKKAKGEYLILTDIDHIISKEVIEAARNAQADVVRFKREAGILDEKGSFTQWMDALRKYGFNRGKLKIAPHGNSYIFKRDLFLELGGVDERFVGTGKYPNREEVPLKQKLKKLAEAGEIKIIDDDSRPTIFMIPNGKYCGEKDYNPFGLFHNLSRKTNIEKRRERAERKK